MDFAFFYAKSNVAVRCAKGCYGAFDVEEDTSEIVIGEPFRNIDPEDGSGFGLGMDRSSINGKCRFMQNFGQCWMSMAAFGKVF